MTTVVLSTFNRFTDTYIRLSNGIQYASTDWAAVINGTDYQPIKGTILFYFMCIMEWNRIKTYCSDAAENIMNIT